MSITVLADVIVPNSILAGRQTINVNWSRTLRQYEFGFVPLSIEQWATIEAMFEVCEGGAFGMLLADPKDQTVKITEGVATLISGTTYQLHKRTTSAGSTRTKDRRITRPIAAGFDIKVSGVSLTGAQYTLNTVTGVVTIPSAPSAATLTWSGSFYVPVHFQSDEIDWDMVRSGPYDTRLLAGPTITLSEVRE